MTERRDEDQRDLYRDCTAVGIRVCYLLFV